MPSVLAVFWVYGYPNLKPSKNTNWLCPLRPPPSRGPALISAPAQHFSKQAVPPATTAEGDAVQARSRVLGSRV